MKRHSPPAASPEGVSVTGRRRRKEPVRGALPVGPGLAAAPVLAPPTGTVAANRCADHER